MPSEHAVIYSPSKLHQYIGCTASAKLEQNYPNITTEYAREGTVAHAVAELAANYKMGNLTDAEYKTGINNIIATEDGRQFFNLDMQAYAEAYGDLITDILADEQCFCPDAFCELEVRVDFSNWAPGGFGTSDCIIVSEHTIEVVDFKYGKGVPVSAENNPQLRMYALGAYEKYKDLSEFQNVRMTIFQPRVSYWPSVEEISLSQLLEWAEEVIKPMVEKIESGNVTFSPDEDTCRFCRAKGDCRARCEKNLALFDENSPADRLTLEEAGEVLAKAKDIKAWLSDLEKFVFESLSKGKTLKDWKLVEGRSNRRFTSEQDVVAAMKAAGYDESLLYERKLISLTQFESNFGKKTVKEILGDYIVKPHGAPTLAPASDKREAWIPEAAALAAFEEE